MSTKQAYSEQELLLQLRENSEAAFTAIYHQYWRLLFSVAANKLDNTTDAEEIVQEVFADLWRRREGITIELSLKSYLAAAVKFQVYSFMAKKAREAQRQAAFPVEETTALSPEEQLYRKELQQQLYDITLQLPDKCRLVYQMSREEGLSNKQIAEQLSISEKTVESQITKALRRLRSGFRSLLFNLFSFFKIFFQVA